jgi:cytochrome c
MSKERQMTQKIVVCLILVSCLLIGATLAFATTTPDDAKAWVKKAVEYYKANGKEKALAAFSDSKGQFCQGDLYIYVLDTKGKMLAHPKAELVGQDFMTRKDIDGNFCQRYCQSGQ